MVYAIFAQYVCVIDNVNRMGVRAVMGMRGFDPAAVLTTTVSTGVALMLGALLIVTTGAPELLVLGVAIVLGMAAGYVLAGRLDHRVGGE